jgi:hypothetical protein
MRAMKLAVAVIGFLALARYLPVYYNSYEFNNFVETEAPRIRIKGQLKDALLSKARSHSLPIDESDISITTHGSVFKVAVDYRVPVDLFAYKPELKFHVVASGLLRE